MPCMGTPFHCLQKAGTQSEKRAVREGALLDRESRHRFPPLSCIPLCSFKVYFVIPEN